MKAQNVRVDVALDDVRIMKESYALYGVLLRIVRQDSAQGSEQVYEQHIYRRFSEFWELKSRLERQFGAELPYELPARKFGLWKRSAVDPTIIEERKAQLAKFLRDLLNDSFDTKWKNSSHVAKFLKLSADWNATAGQPATNPGAHQTQSLDLKDAVQWMIKLKDCKTALEQAKQVGNSHRSKLLMELRLDLYNMETGLREQVSTQQIDNAESERRSNLLTALKRDINEMALEKAYDTDTHFSEGDSAADDHDRVKSALFPDLVSQRTPKKPLAGRRKFGETNETEQLDNQQLLQLHKSKMRDQDKELEEMRKIIQRQKNLSVEMNQELAQQNDLLDLMGNDVDNTATRLRTANRKAKQFNND